MSFGLLGQKLSHSYSQLIHNMIGAYEYKLFEVPPDDLEDFIVNGDYNGLNVTIPYKEEVMKYVKCDDLSTKLGAVNTIYHKNGTLMGTNTDFFGFMYLLSLNEINLKDKKVLILGTGGASKVVQGVANASEAKKVFVASRHKSGDYVNYKNLPLDVDIIVNATPIGTYPNSYDRIIDISGFTNLEAVIDLIYNPAKTDLLIQAEKRGIKTANGLSMLVAQATKAARAFVDINYFNYNKQLIVNVLAYTLNIVLVGMPGAGKSTLGRKLAQMTSRTFVDIDETIEEREGIPISDLINTMGEVYFRDLESEIIKEFSKETGLVIATGGGAVMREENRDALRSNSVVVEVERPIKLLEMDGRPLSKDIPTLRQLYLERNKYYHLTRDLEIVNSSTNLDDIETLADNLLDKIGGFYDQSINK